MIARPLHIDLTEPWTTQQTNSHYNRLVTTCSTSGVLVSRRTAYLSSTVCMDVIESLASLNICARAAGLSGNSQKGINGDHITWWWIHRTISTVCLKLIHVNTPLVYYVLEKITLGGETTENSSPHLLLPSCHFKLSMTISSDMKVSTGYHRRSAMHTRPTVVHRYNCTVRRLCMHC